MEKLGILVALGLMTLGVAPSPAPSLPPIIAHVRSNPICTVLRVQSGTAIGGLMLNDNLIASAQPVLGRFYNDRYAAKSGRADLDVIAMREIAYRMAHNLETIDKVLATMPTPAPLASPSADDAKVATLRKQFNDVEDAQRKAIDIISGLAETDALSDLQNRPDPMMGALNPTTSTAATATASPPPEGSAGLPIAPGQAQDPRVLTQGISVGNNAITPFVQELGVRAAVVSQREDTLTDTIVRAAKECGGQAGPTPSP